MLPGATTYPPANLVMHHIAVCNALFATIQLFLGLGLPARHHRPVPDLPRRPLQQRYPGRPDRRPDHSRRARPERARRPGAVRRPGPVAAAPRPVNEVGLGYLRLGEPTPSLSGGESQRLRIASRLRSSQRGTLYVLDEPSTGLHPLDVATLAGVFGRLLQAGATIIVIDHDLDLLAAADHLIDMGPGGGPDGGHIVAAGTPEDVARDPGSVTGPWLAEHLGLPEARQGRSSLSSTWAALDGGPRLG